MNELIQSFIHSFIYAISIGPLQVRYYSKALPTQHGYCAGVSGQSATGNRVKDLPKVPTWRLERDSNPLPTTIRSKGIDSTNAPPYPRLHLYLSDFLYICLSGCLSMFQFVCVCLSIMFVLLVPSMVIIIIFIKFSFIWRRNTPSDTNAEGIYKYKLMTKNQLITTTKDTCMRVRIGH